MDDYLREYEFLNTNWLSEERKKEILERLKTEHYNLFIKDKDFISRLILKKKYHRLLNCKTLFGFLVERKSLHDKGICYGSLEEILTKPHLGITEEELRGMGLNRNEIKRWMQLHQETISGVTAIIGEEEYKKVFPWRVN